MLSNYQVYLLHGFLGCPSDWSFLPNGWSRVDLFKSQSSEGLESWAEAFNAGIEQQGQKKILIGYSLGGRLALHALADRPDLWDAAVIVSSNPGLSSFEEKASRLKGDLQWAKRFQVDPWDILMRDWNAQPVFSGDHPKTIREEQNYSRDTLASVLDRWSLGRQHDLRSAIQRMSLPFLWIAGERDIKFSSIAGSLKFSHPKSKVWIAPEAGHGVPWLQKGSFKEQLEIFFKEII